jgi:hypothetical protein
MVGESPRDQKKGIAIVSSENETASDDHATESAEQGAEASEQASSEPAGEDASTTEGSTGEQSDSAGGQAVAAPAAAASGADEEDRRRAYRLNKVLGATLTSLSGDSTAARLFIIDISRSGFRATDHQPHREEQYDIAVVLAKGQEPFQSRMRVVWTKELTVSGMFQMGCEFVDPAEEELAKLDSFIESERKKVENAPKAPIDLGRPWTMIR